MMARGFAFPYGPLCAAGLCASLLASGCGKDEQELNCRDLLPASAVSYQAVAMIVTDPNDDRSCTDCHNSKERVRGLDLGTPKSAYPALVRRMPSIYAQVASGSMPDDGEPWSDDDLRLLRSWYCYGALYDEP